MQQELDLLKTKRDTINDTNNELKRQYEYQQRLMNLQKDQVQAKISGDYIGASILGQQKSFEAGQFNQETDALALDKKITNLENAISAIQATNKVTAAQKALSGKAMGGLIKGPGTSMSDSIRAKVNYATGGAINVSNGEYVVRAAAVRNYGVPFMNALNSQKVGTSSTTGSSSGGTVYNIDMTINGGNQNPNEIADQVIRRLKLESSRNNKSNAVKY
jgi:hypothetical protein